MLLHLKDGPGRGHYSVRRAPLFLRAVVGPDGLTDVLDQIDDEPRESESVHVYKATGNANWTFVCSRGRGGCQADRERTYLHCPEVDGESLRDTQAWREWVIRHAGAPVDRRTGKIVLI